MRWEMGVALRISNRKWALKKMLVIAAFYLTINRWHKKLVGMSECLCAVRVCVHCCQVGASDRAWYCRGCARSLGPMGIA